MVARVAVGLGLVAYLGLSGAINWGRLLGLANAWELTIAAAILLVLVVLAASWRLCLVLSGQGLRLPLSASFRLSLVGALFGNFLPGSNGGDLARVYFATRLNTGRRTEIATALLVDRLVGLSALLAMPLLIALPGRALVPHTAPIGGLVFASVLALGALLGLFATGLHPDGAARRLVLSVTGRTRFGPHALRVFESVRTLRQNPAILLAGFAVSLLIQTLIVLAIQVILLANGARATSWGAALLTPFGMLANALPLTPGGLGVGEAAFESLFLFAGVTGGAEAILSWRLLTTLIDICGGGLLAAGRTDIPVTRAHG
jgi:hypothetical protein